MVVAQANISSLMAFQDFANANADNIANVNSDGFVPTRTTFSERNGGVQANFQKADDNGSTQSQTDLTKEITDQIVIEKGSEVQGMSIRTEDNMIGSLLNILA